MKVEATGVTKLEKVLQPQALAVVFGASVAKVEDHAGLPVTTGIRMEPAVEWQWKWVGDTRLVFRPKSDWAAGPKYHITLDRSIFPKHVLLERYEVDMQTASFVATMPKIEFYTDPTDPTVKQIVATLEFTHRVDMVALEKKLSLAMLGGADVFKKGAPRFTLTAGLHQRTAYLRTSALVLPEREDFMRVTLAKGLRLVQGSEETAVDIEKNSACRTSPASSVSSRWRARSCATMRANPSNCSSSTPPARRSPRTSRKRSTFICCRKSPPTKTPKLTKRNGRARRKSTRRCSRKRCCCRSSSSRPARKTPTCTVSGSASKPPVSFS